jgi:hypothetical protein
MMPNGPHRITGMPFEEELFSSEHSVKDADIQVRHLFCILNNKLIEECRLIIFRMLFYTFIKKSKQINYMTVKVTQIN